MGDLHTILVVDDDMLIRWALRQALSAMGIRVVEAADGHQALAVIRREAPALILLDLAMPGMNGCGVLDAMKRDGCQIPVVVVTAASEPFTRARMADLGVVEVVRKPFDAQEVALVAARVLG